MTKVPGIGTFRGRISNDWKTGAALALLLPFAARAAEFAWSTNRFEEGRTAISSALEADHVRGPAAPVRKAAQTWNIAWPVSADTGAAVRVRAELSQLIAGALEDYPFPVVTDDSPAASIRICAARFNAEFKDLLKLDPATAQRYEASVRLAPALLTRKLLAVTAETDVYSGGAHGIGHRRHAVFDAQTGARLAFDEIFPAVARPGLLAALTASFRTAHGLKPEQSLKDGGLFENTLSLTSNFVADATGVVFTYDPYEIAPYSEGRIDIRLPWSEAQGLLATGSALRAEADVRAAGKAAS